jgi:hypothetical protein
MTGNEKIGYSKGSEETVKTSAICMLRRNGAQY